MDAAEKRYSFDEVIVMGTQIGINAGMEYIRKEKEKRRKSRYDRRLRNTKLLLREYRKLKSYCQDAIYSTKQLEGNAIDILDEIDGSEYDNVLYIDSIKKSKDRTLVIIEHINKMIDIFRYYSEASKRPEETRRFHVVYDMYIGNEEKTAEEIAERYAIEQRTVYRDINKAAETLSALIFGIDGLNVI